MELVYMPPLVDYHPILIWVLVSFVMIAVCAIAYFASYDYERDKGWGHGAWGWAALVCVISFVAAIAAASITSTDESETRKSIIAEAFQSAGYNVKSDDISGALQIDKVIVIDVPIVMSENAIVPAGTLAFQIKPTGELVLFANNEKI